MICKHPLPHLTKSQAFANLNSFQLASKNRNYPQGSFPLGNPGEGVQQGHSFPHVFSLDLQYSLLHFEHHVLNQLGLFCYKPEVNRFYSSSKSVTRDTAMISLINIHNSSSPALQANWATLHEK